MSSPKRASICLDLPEPAYRALEKIAYVKGSTIERVALEALNLYINIVRDVDDHYRFKYERVLEETRRLIEEAVRKGEVEAVRVKVEDVAITLGKLVTLLKETYGSIPREVTIDKLREDREKLAIALRRVVGRARVGGRDLDPVSYLVNRVKELGGVARAFGIEVHMEGGEVRRVRFNNVNLLDMYHGYIARVLRRKLR